MSSTKNYKNKRVHRNIKNYTVMIQVVDPRHDAHLKPRSHRRALYLVLTNLHTVYIGENYIKRVNIM